MTRDQTSSKHSLLKCAGMTKKKRNVKWLSENKSVTFHIMFNKSYHTSPTKKGPNSKNCILDVDEIMRIPSDFWISPKVKRKIGFLVKC